MAQFSIIINVSDSDEALVEDSIFAAAVVLKDDLRDILPSATVLFTDGGVPLSIA